MRKSKVHADKHPLLKYLTISDDYPFQVKDIQSHLMGTYLGKVKDFISRGLELTAIKVDNGLMDILTHGKVANMGLAKWGVMNLASKFGHEDDTPYYFSFPYGSHSMEVMICALEDGYYTLALTFVVKGLQPTLLSNIVRLEESAEDNTPVSYTIENVKSLEDNFGEYEKDGLLSPMKDGGVLMNAYSLISSYFVWKDLFQKHITTEAINAKEKKADLGFRVNGLGTEKMKVTVMVDHIDDRTILTKEHIRCSHIRMQRVGPNRSIIKPVLVRASTVKAYTRR